MLDSAVQHGNSRSGGSCCFDVPANPDLSPFDIRNIMQETATYRQCHYMLLTSHVPMI